MPGILAPTAPVPAETLTFNDMKARGLHAVRISYNWPFYSGRLAMWVECVPNFGWSIMQGYVGHPASVLTSPADNREGCVKWLNEHIGPRHGDDPTLTVDEWDEPIDNIADPVDRLIAQVERGAGAAALPNMGPRRFAAEVAALQALADMGPAAATARVPLPEYRIAVQRYAVAINQERRRRGV